MKVVRLAVPVGLIAAIFAGSAAAQESGTQDLRQPASARRAAFAYNDYSYYAPHPGATSSPSDAPPAAPAKPAPAAKSNGNGQQPPAEANGNATNGNATNGNGNAAEEAPQEEEAKPWQLFGDCPFLKCNRIDVRGWLDQGYTWNPDNPANRFNTPVAYNDRANGYQMNQLYLIAERLTKTDGCGWDIGGRVDMLYGTDYRFPVSTGFDNTWSEGQYGLVMPQAYVDLACNDLIIRAGHFLAPCGYESVMAPENFFYSHSYSFLYDQPTTLTGGSLIYKINDNWSVNSGVDTGWNDFTDVSQKLNYFGGVNWTSKNKKSTAALEVFSGAQVAGSESIRNHYCLVLTHQLTDRWKFALEHNYAQDTDSPASASGLATFWDVAGYAFYEINKCWSVGMRLEYDADESGVVTPFGDQAFHAGHFIGLTGGINYKPNLNVTVRSEIRGDWSGVPAGGPQPFDDLSKSDQFLWATDLIVKF